MSSALAHARAWLALIAFWAALSLVAPAHAIDTSLCNDDGVTSGLPPFATQDGNQCTVIDPGNGEADILFQFEQVNETSVGQACDGGGSTVDLVTTKSGGPKTHLWYNLVLDNYRSQACQNDDIVFVGGGSPGTGKYDHEFFYIVDSVLKNGWKCAGSAWTGSGPSAGLSCGSTKSKAHSDGIQYRGNPVANGWFFMQGTEPGKCRFLNGYNEHMLMQVDDAEGELGSIGFQGCEIGRSNEEGWIDDCYDRNANPSDPNVQEICERGGVEIGNGPQLVFIADVWGTARFHTTGDGGIPDLIVVVNSGCDENGCNGTRGYNRGWPHPLERPGTGPGTCAGSASSNGLIGTSPPTYCFPSIEDMIVGATAAGLDLDPYRAGEQHQPPMVTNSPAGWADAPGAGLGGSATLSPNPVEISSAFTMTVDPQGGTAPYTITYDLDGDGACDDGATDTTDPSSEGGTAPATPGTRTLKACISDDAAASIERLVVQTTVPDCGDGTITAPEVCDTNGPQLGGETCTDQGFSGGTLGCAAGCGAFDTSACTGGPTCGDDVCSPNEAAAGGDSSDPAYCFEDCAAYTASIVCKNEEGWDYCSDDLQNLAPGERISLKDSLTREFAIFIDIDPLWTDQANGGITSMWLDHTGPAGEPNRDTRQNNPVYVFPGDTGPGGIQNTLPWSPPLLKGSHRFQIRPCSEDMDGPTNAPTAANCTGAPGGVLGPEVDITLSFQVPQVVELPGRPSAPRFALPRPGAFVLDLIRHRARKVARLE